MQNFGMYGCGARGQRYALVTLNKFQPVLLMDIETHRCANYGIDPKELFSLLESLGYRYSVFTLDALLDSTNLADDMETGRDFVFYNDTHHLKR